MHLLNRKGQNTAEYAILIAVVIGAIVAMQIYVKRGLQAKVKHVSDGVGDGLLDTTGVGYPAVTSQYEPYYNETNYKVSQDQKVQEQFKTGGLVRRDSQSEETKRSGSGNTRVDQAADINWK